MAFNNVSQIVLVSAPSSYTGVLPYDFTSTINTFGVAVLVNLPPGTYICNIVDSCGNTAVLTETITPVSAAPSYGIFPDCSNNNINTVSIHGQLNAIILTTAPATYTGTVPHDFTLQVLNGSLNLVNLPVGTYNFMVTNSCGNVVTLNVIVPVQTETFTVNAAQNCGSFNLDLHYTSNGAGASTFWLQKYYTTGADWGDPDTGVLQGTDIPNDNNALQLTNNFLTLNLPYSGQFRVVKVQPVYIPGSDVPGYCFKVINEFQTNGQPQIIGVNSVACNGAFDVIVEATGFGPLTYKITAKNGLPFIINNGNSNLFSGLTAAVYNFQVTDFCGNIVNSVLEINVQNPLTITAVNLCPNEAASLSVPNFSFLTYQWWNTNNPSVILSTTNILNFPNFNPTTSAGTYTVGIVYVGNSSSCLNTQLNYAITSNNFMPNAGNGTTVAYCGGQPTFDLFTLLQGPYDTGGTWQVVTNNTSISGSSWNSTNAAALLYQFKYTVTGNCSISDQTIVSVTIKDIPQIPIATVDPIVCDSQNINLFASAIPGASYLWTGPNGFSSSNQNPVINNATTLDNGSYSVKAIEAGCESNESAVDVLVSPSPQFTLEGLCNGGRFKVTAIPVNYSFDPSSVSYSWSGPNGYTNTVNPIDITQLPTGDYSLTITNISGCISSQSIPVSYTFCEIPNVITPNDDGANDSFDLSGLEVEKLEIYSRWGRKVYEKDNYTNEWHGQNMHGDYLPDSTYYYYITLKNKEAKVGWVFMTRG